MSATNRGTERRFADQYITPDWCVRRIMQAYPHIQAGTVLDPCAARGELLTEIKKLRPRIEPIAFELQENCAEGLAFNGINYKIGNFLEMATEIEDKAVPWIVTNPPFSLALDFIRECTRIAEVAIMLLRLPYLRHKPAIPLLKKLRPAIFQPPDRPSFTGFGTDSTEYSWFVFGDPTIAGQWFYTEATPEEEIKRWNAYARSVCPPDVVKEMKNKKALKKAEKLEREAMQ